MRISEIYFARDFRKQFAKLPFSVKELAQEKIEVFKEDPFDQRLKTHKLHGREKEYLAFSINQTYRIKFAFLEDDEVFFAEIGTHDIYK
jgi:mRNA-degrading endonuclease YafQ of YafQ-DinJ toxin-antitoxin module